MHTLQLWLTSPEPVQVLPLHSLDCVYVPANCTSQGISADPQPSTVFAAGGLTDQHMQQTVKTTMINVLNLEALYM